MRGPGRSRRRPFRGHGQPPEDEDHHRGRRTGRPGTETVPDEVVDDDGDATEEGELDDEGDRGEDDEPGGREPVAAGHERALGVAGPRVGLLRVAHGAATRPRVTSAAVAVRCPAKRPARRAAMAAPLTRSSAIFSWRRMIPCSRASGRGGQPGT